MRHTFAIAGRELRSYFVSPIAYAVLTLWAVIAGFFFVAYVGFYAQMQQYPDPAMLERLNLNEQIVIAIRAAAVDRGAAAGARPHDGVVRE